MLFAYGCGYYVKTHTYGIVHEKRDLAHIIKKCYKNGIMCELL